MSDNPKPCSRCGRPHAKCSAHTRTGNPCGQKPMAGQTVCRMHGGSAPQSIEAAERRRLERQALTAAESFGLPREVDPHTALLEELHRTAGAVQWLGAIVADLDKDQVVWGKVKETRGTQLEKGAENGTTYAAQTNAFVRMWQEERDRLVKVAKACHDAGIEERRVRIAESTGQQLAAFARSLLDRMLGALVEAIGPERAAELALQTLWAQSALVIVPEEFRRLAGEGTPSLEAGGAA